MLFELNKIYDSGVIESGIKWNRTSEGKTKGKFLSLYSYTKIPC